MRRLIATAVIVATIPLVASGPAAIAESRFGWGTAREAPLEAKCLSDSRDERDQCFGYIEALLDHYQPVMPYAARTKAAAAGAARARQDLRKGSISKREIGCYLEDFYTLRNVAITGYRETLEHAKWLSSIDGKVRMAGRSSSIAPRDLVEKIEPAHDSIRELRLTGKVSWHCQLGRWFFGRD